jgi:S-DNA-T family DNA segregation ATPase FtsK/SpoIIIE
VSELGEIDLGNSEIKQIFMMVMNMARAIEVNTILCTQQFSEERLPEIILSNTPVKIAFKLPYKEDSKRIIGKKGAEDLLGQGDMVYTNEVDYWKMQGFHY